MEAGTLDPVPTEAVTADETTDPERRVGGRMAAAPYVVASFTGSFLLFLVQPLVAKMLLPSLGGSPSVWNTSQVFFQVALVAGYALAHIGMRLLAPRVQRRLQVVLLALPLVTLPIALPGGWAPPTTGSPVGWTLAVLALTVGAPFLVLSTCSPTIQHWFATSERTAGRDPYFLYAAGNAGSLLALVSYPVLIEPRLSVDGQARMFTIGYVALVAISAACALRRVSADATSRTSAETAAEEEATPGREGAITWARRGRWMIWAAVPSALMLGVTRHLTTDVMSVPMLWIAPLSIYLLTFIVAFGRHTDRLVRIAAHGVRFAVIPLTVSMLAASKSLVFVAALHLIAFGLVALLGHARLAADRPAPRHLTEFYLWVSIGGAIGGITTSLIAPAVFPTVIEYPLAIAAALFMLPEVRTRAVERVRTIDVRTVVGALAVVAVAVVAAIELRNESDDSLAIIAILVGVTGVVAYKLARTPRGFAATIGLLVMVSIVPQPDAITTDRSFFGVTTVEANAAGEHLLMSGTTLHGRQDFDRDDPTKPLSYYHPEGPVGGLMAETNAAAGANPQRVGVVGLGAGSLASYGRAGDTYDFYEIDPAVARIAQDTRYFTFLSESEADVDIVMGDGRLNLERTDATYDVLVLDAFSSDAIPLHLLTQEAVATYTEHLTDDGVLAIHISNRYFGLEPVLARLAHEQGLAGVVGDHNPTPEQVADGDEAQLWVFLAADAATLEPLTERADARVLDPAGDGPLWTDDFSDILSVFHIE